MRRNKKGFTVVELSIVIVVIAILAAILIPTIISLVNKANVANDTALVRNLNTALALDGGEKHETMQDALDAAKDAGYDVAKINAKATDNEILWDSANDVFCYKKGDEGITYVPETTLSVENVKDYQYWVIASAPSSTYSTYLYNYSGNGTEDITTGIDVGNETVSTINYANTGDAQSTAIRTNGGKLTINGSKDTIKHYGTSAEIEIVSVSSNSFYEFGDTKLISIANGRLVLTDAETANVEAIYLTATEQNYNNITLATMSNATLPEAIKRDAVDETSEKVVCQIQTNVDSNGANAEKTETIVIKAAQTVQEQTSKYTGVSELGQKVLEAPTGSTEENAATYVGNKVAVSSEAKESIKTGYILFSGGQGTKEDPYLIDTMDNWMNFRNSTEATNGKYWSVNCDLDFAEYSGSEKYYDVPMFNGNIDFNNHNVKNLYLNNCENIYSGCYGGLFFQVVGKNTVISNLNFTLTCTRRDCVVRLIHEIPTTLSENNLNITLKNVNTYGNVSFADNNASCYIFYIWSGREVSVTFDDCDNYASVDNNQTTAAYVGGVGKVPSAMDTKSDKFKESTKLIFKNCDNYGTIKTITTEAKSASMFVANDLANNVNKLSIEMTNNVNYGTLLSVGGQVVERLVVASNNLYESITNNQLKNSDSAIVTTINKVYKITKNGDYYNFNTVDTATKYEFVASSGSTTGANGGNHSIRYEITKENISKIPYLEFYVGDNAYIGNTTTNEYGFQVYSGKYVFKGEFMSDEQYITAQPSIMLIAYDANGEILCISEL